MSEDEPLVRMFVLHDDIIARQLYEFLRQREELARFGQVLQVVVSKYCPSTKQQMVTRNRRMWKGYLEPIASQARLNDYRARAEDWHKILKAMWLPEVCAKGVDKWLYLENGDRVLTMSTGDLNEEEFAKYLHEIGAYASTDLGVRFPVNPRDVQGTHLQIEA